uniref:Uncharacterized protein LOC104211015 n=1 Tax=Nicotiana sylvestris TaxID=4096 RepID=A0A1U7V7U0_NICSY|nr:PREDICTED: uncharacterized protein LOC104211015 [Nicotiana sylvestris]
MQTSKEQWDVLEKKYKIEETDLKKFVAVKFLDYRQQGCHYPISRTASLVINEAFQIASMIEKLPPLWRDFKNYFKHKCKEMKLEDLIVRLRIEEDNKTAEKKTRGNSTTMGANIVEVAPTNPKKRKKPSGPKSYPNKKKLKGNCHNYENLGHKAAECRVPNKEKKKGQANMVKTNNYIDDLCTMLSECNLVRNPKEWWIDSGATRDVCVVREAFASYAPAGPDKIIFMGNSATAKIEGYRKIFLKITSSKVVTLNNVFHVPEIRKNLVSISLLVKNGFKYVFVSDKVVINTGLGLYSENEHIVAPGNVVPPANPDGPPAMDQVDVSSRVAIHGNLGADPENSVCRDAQAADQNA